MPKKIKFKVNVGKPCAPVVEVDTVAQALYVYFQRGVKIAEDVRRYAAEQEIGEAEATKQGVVEKAKEFVAAGARVFSGI